ncbi:MAG: hypothetical protein FWE23_03115 [Chitinivibrionia bacterium]|nr:hypothetical protein [Chitinivibrionia bacterium]
MQKIMIIVALLVFSVFAQTIRFEPNAAIDNRIDEIIYMISSRCGTALPRGISQQPMNYEELRRWIADVENCQNLTQTDRQTLEILKNRFEGNARIAEIRSEDDEYRVLLNLDLTGQGRFDGDVDARGIVEPRITANLGAFSFYSDIYVLTQFRSDTPFIEQNYQPFRGPTFNTIGGDTSHFRAMDGFRAGISKQTDRFRFDVAVDNLTSGPAAHNRLMLNIVDEPVFYARAALDFGRMQYYKIFGMLRELNHLNKFIYYHRAQVPFFDGRLTLGINASIISGSTGDAATMAEPPPQGQVLPDWDLNRTRRIEPVYMIPFVPYFFAEHFAGDLDNKQIGFDLELRMPQIARWYMEFFIDDGTAPHTLFNDQWANKWALTVGTQWFPVIAGRNAIFGFEYCRVEPWVYTHFRGAAANHAHFGRNIGAELGPNSAQIRGLSQFAFSQRHALRLEAVHNRYNRNVRGGSLGDVFVYPHLAERLTEEQLAQIGIGIEGDSERKQFLSGDITKEYEINLSHIFRQFGRFEMTSSVFYNSEKGAGVGVWGGFRF